MDLRRSKVLLVIFVSRISISTKIKCDLNRSHLNWIKRKKIFGDKKDKVSKESEDVTLLNNNLNSLTKKCDQLEDYLRIVAGTNKKILDDNMTLCLEILKLRKETELKSEKLMLIMMNLMHKVKSSYSIYIDSSNHIITETNPIIVDSSFIHTELDNYFKKTETEEITADIFKIIRDKNINKQSYYMNHFPAMSIPLKEKVDSDSETNIKNVSRCGSIEEVISRSNNLEHGNKLKLSDIMKTNGNIK